MKTNEEIESILSHLIDKLNRVEAAQADVRSAVAVDPSIDAIESAIVVLADATSVLISRAHNQQTKTNDILGRICQALRGK